MEPLVLEFDIDATPEHAFEVWTTRVSLWWPKSHTVTKEDSTEIVVEPFEGGRIYEKGPDGEEHAWGEVLDWEPPVRLVYLWHLFFPRSEATKVSVTFTADGGRTRMRIEQTGFEILGEEKGPARRERTERVWSGMAELYIDAL